LSIVNKKKITYISNKQQQQKQIMLKHISKCILPFVIILSGCQSLPQLFTAAEEIADDNAIKIEVQKEAINQNSNISVTLDVTNKEIQK
jgi:serine kinase of HPr protein (carbohydrate metabolism regulator)